MQSTTHACEVCGHLFYTDEELREHLLAAHELEPLDTEDISSEDEEATA